MSQHLLTLARRLSFLVAAALAIVLPARTALASTTITGGNITVATWTPAGSPYIIQGDVTVVAGGTLTIQAGTVVQFASTDGQAGGLDATRVELTVKGTLNVNGVSGTPVTFQSQAGGTTANVWYGIVLDAASTGASISYAKFSNSQFSVQSNASTYTPTIADSTFDSATYGVLVGGGSASVLRDTMSGLTYGVAVSSNSGTVDIQNLTVTGCSYGVYDTGYANVNVTSSLIYGNSSYGIFHSLGTVTTQTLNVTGSTINANGSYGIYLRVVNSATLNLNVKNCNITNQSNGVYLYSNTGYYGTIAGTGITYSNVWGNPSFNLYNVSGGAGFISCNPLYVSASNLRLTANSPSRNAGDTGGDIGALPYTGDATPGLYGTLWTNTHLTSAGSPYAVAGDIVVPAGVTLTVDPGVTLNFATTDIMGCGQTATQGELTVNGSLVSNGTSGSPIRYTSSGASAGSWWGVTMSPGATSSSITNAVIDKATYGLYWGATAATGLTVANDTFQNDTYGVYVAGGSPTLDTITATGNSYGVYYASVPAGTITSSLIVSNSSYGIYATLGTTTTSTLNVTGSTINANGSYGIYARVVNSATFNLNVKNCNVTNQSNGIYAYSNTGWYGTLNAAITYSNVWGNPSYNLYNVSGGTGFISCNPLYVSPTNLRLTANSPSRNAGDTGGDIGALPYTGDATPGLYGTLWTNTHLTSAGSPYAVAGDIVVPAGVTLTVDPGVTLNFATTDIMGCGQTTTQGELTVNGSLVSNGTSGSPIRYTSSGASAGSWWGVTMSPGATSSSITNAVIDKATYGLYWGATAATGLTVANDTFQNDTYGVYVAAGSPTLDTITATGNSYGVYYASVPAGTITSSLIVSNSSYGIYATLGTTSTSTLNVTGSTINANGSYGIYARVVSSATFNLNVKNCNVTNQSNGIYAYSSTGWYGTLNAAITYSNVWGNPSYNLYNVSAGTGYLSCNPLYVSASNLRLTANSPSRNAGDTGGDIGALPYTGDATPGLYGTLWTNTHLTAAGSPYNVAGDIVVPAGVTLTVDPGVTLNFATSDIMGCGQTTTQGELTVNGSLVSIGTAGSPIRYTSAGTSAGSWWGITMNPGATSSTISTSTIDEATYGLYWQAPAAGNAVANDTFQNDTYGVYVAAGSPTLDTITATGNSYGVYYASVPAGTITSSLIVSNSSYGIYATLGTTTTSTLNVTGSTINANGSYGIYARAVSSATFNLNVKNCNVTNQGYGLYAYSNTGWYGTINAAVTYSNVWGNPSSNFYNLSPGTGTLSCNPLYVSAANLRLTANSPSRKSGEGGVDIGALPYTGDATPGLYGTLWSDVHLTAAGSPYSIAGDIVVPAGVTLTVDPGVTMSFATTDIMACGQATTQSELTIGGTLNATGTTAAPIKLTSPGASAGSWWGVNVQPPVLPSSISHATVERATYGIYWQPSSTGHNLSYDVLQNDTYGFYVPSGGSATLDASTMTGNSYGAYYGGAPAGALTNDVIVGNSSYGIYANKSTPGTSSLQVANCTVHANGSYGLYTAVGTGQTLNLDVRNCIVTQQSNGLYAYSNTGYFGTLNATIVNSDVWGNTTNNYYNLSAGTGCISQNPSYVAPPGDLHLMQSPTTSVCIDTGTATSAPTHDRDGGTRPADGDGINGAAFDMGAYEMGAVTSCGDGAVNGNEVCDDGVLNGTYGHCKVDCSGLGPHCGDGVVNGGEQCDDANFSNTDACLTTCKNATCGDGFVQAGVEQCDDANAVNTDACLTTCKNASCGDGFIWSGKETCDDGNTNTTDACPACQPAACGDGYTWAGKEQCDDGNAVATDSCTNACTNAVCGDGVIWAGVEDCDDTNSSNNDACLNTCKAAKCGDGFLFTGVETCDDGNTVNGDGCDNTCKYSCVTPTTDCTAVAPECQKWACSAGHVCTGVSDTTKNGTACSSGTCNNGACGAGCGNGVVESGEDCDFGSGNGPGTGCESTCKFSCTKAPDSCPDSNVCNGVEACTTVTVSGHTGQKCAPGTSQAKCAACSGGVCNGSGVCTPTTCGDGCVSGTEQCDDGNAVNGDGCDTTCKYSCANPATDCTGSAPACQMWSCTGGHVCAATADASKNGTSCGTLLICQGGSCVSSCGNGVVDPGEQCDFGASNGPGTGCEVTCKFSCTTAPDSCPDANTCNGAEACTAVTVSGHAGQKCTAGTNAAKCVGCTGGVCDGQGACVAAACGDGCVSGSEQCDDGNAVNGDGCDTTCKYSCASPATDCAGAPPACQMWSCTAGHVCAAVADASKNGTVCAGGTCNNGACGNSCGNGTVEAGEDCDFGASNGPGTGCETTCKFSCSKAPDSCPDANACNGTEACATVVVSGHTGQKCSAGTNVAKCASCSGGVCDGAGACAAAICGDGCVTGTEQCDDGNAVNGDGCDMTCKYSCSNPASDCVGAAPACQAWTCTAGHVCSATADATKNGTICGTLMICQGGTCTSSCGNGTVDAGEQCDFGSGNGSGTGCEANCKFSCTMAPDSCADANICNGTETCTALLVNGHAGQKCAAGTNAGKCIGCSGGVCDGTGTCTAAFCGDGCIEGTEQCDDGNAVNGDGCDVSCKFSCSTPSTDCVGAAPACEKWTCTSGHVCAAAPDSSKDGTVCATGEICSAGVCGSSCGNATVDVGEDCDFGTGNGPGTGCESNCKFSCAKSPDSCGDSNLCNGVEVCTTMTSNGQTGQKCAAGSNAAKCIACSGGVCDGNGACAAPTCGDACVEGTEQCDDGNTDETDACLASCVNASCGDGHTWVGHEQCDDGNKAPGDGCDATCHVEPDGGTDAGEDAADAAEEPDAAEDATDAESDADAADAPADTSSDAADASDASKPDAPADAASDAAADAPQKDATVDGGGEDAGEGDAADESQDLEFSHDTAACACRAGSTSRTSSGPALGLLALGAALAIRARRRGRSDRALRR